MCSPDFLGIGAQKSGTRWLYENLKNHPQISPSPLKEIHYFDLQKKENWKYHPIQTIDFASRKRKLLKSHFLSRSKNNLKDIINFRYSMSNFLWDINYFFRFRNDDWYLNLFSKKLKGANLSGEITPAYSILPENLVQHISYLCPNTKIIFLIRNPVERAWSSAVTTIPNEKKVSDMPFSHFKWAFNRKASLIRDDYITSIDIWSKFYNSNNFYIGFFDEIKNNPENLLLDICDFLGVSTNFSFFENSATKIFQSSKGIKGKSPQIPKECELYLYKKNYKLLKKLHERYGSYASKWLEQANKIL